MFKFQKSWKIRTAKKCDLYLKKLIIAGLRSYKDLFIEWTPLALNWYKNSANIVSGVYTDYSCYSTTLGPIKAAWEGFLEDRLAIVVDRRFFSKWRNIQVIPVNALSFIGTTKKYVSHSVNRKTRTLKFMEFSTDWGRLLYLGRFWHYTGVGWSIVVEHMRGKEIVVHLWFFSSKLT